MFFWWNKISRFLATHIYTGTLTTDSKLKDTGKQKQNLAINSGAMTLFNGVDQSIPIINGSTVQGNFTVGFFAPASGASTVNFDTVYYFGISGVPICRWSDNYFGNTTVNEGDYLSFVISDSTTLTIYINGVLDSIHTGDFSVQKQISHIGTRPTNIFTQGSVGTTLVIPQSLTPKQVKYLHDYPHKAVAHYNVNDAYTTPYLPDVTANLNMPLTEKGKYKIDYSKAFGGELVVNGGFDSDLSGWTVVLNEQTVEWSSGRAHIVSDGSFCALTQYPISKDGSYLVTFDTEVVSGKLGVQYGSNIYKEYTTTQSVSYIWSALNGDYLQFKRGDVCDVYVDNVSVREVTAYEVANYTTSCDLTQQEDGLQLITYKQNNGILEKLQDDRMNLTGEERPAIQLDMTDTELGNKWFINLVIKREVIAESRYLLYSYNSLTGIKFYTNVSWNGAQYTVYLYGNDSSITRISIINDNLFHIITLENDGTNLTMVTDGVAGAPVAHSFVPSGLNFKDSIQQAPKGEMQIEIGTEALWSKYDRAKNYARLLDIKTNLEAN